MSPLDRADHDALDEEALEEGVQDQQGQGGGDDDAVLDQVAQALLEREGGGILDHISQRVLKQNIAQHQLQRIFLRRFQINQGIEVAVPVIDRIEEDHDGNDGLAQRKDHAEEKLRVAGAVKRGGFEEFIRDGLLEKRARDDEVPRADRDGQDQSPHGVVEIKRNHQKIGGDETAGKNHGEGDAHHEEIPPDEVFS